MGNFNILSYLIFIFVYMEYVRGRQNVLFLVADDLGTHLSAYEGSTFPSGGHSEMVTPNINKLASRSLLLKQAYVQYAICSPSRTSTLTGRRPDTTRVYDLQTYWRNSGGNFTTIPQYFKENGYETVGMGKIFHAGQASGKDDPPSWTNPDDYFRPANTWNLNTSWYAVSPQERNEVPLPDDVTTAAAIAKLQEFSENPDSPFFLAVGFKKPHLPFVFPVEFLDYYPPEILQLPTNPYAPVDMPRVHWINSGELRNNYEDIIALNTTGEINSTLPDDKTLELRRAYYSTISYVDSLVGELMDALEDFGLLDNTIVSFWGDHGFQLGEHGIWCKHTNFQLAVQAPMMIAIPGKTDDGVVTYKNTEFVDLFPTLVDAVDLPPLTTCPEASNNVDVCTEGTSLMELIDNPESNSWKKAAFSQYYRWDRWMGYTVKYEKYRYTEWVSFTPSPDFEIDWDKDNGKELYDHENDYEETINLAYIDDYKSVVELLSEILRNGWRDNSQSISDEKHAHIKDNSSA